MPAVSSEHRAAEAEGRTGEGRVQAPRTGELPALLAFFSFPASVPPLPPVYCA